MDNLKKNYVWGILFLAIVLFSFVFYGCINYELNHAYTADAPLYWTVGRGMLNGIFPYTGLYENKPLMIFLLSAINFLITDDTIVCNFFTLVALASVAFVPLLIFKECLKTDKISEQLHNNYYLICFLLTFLSGILLMIFCEERSGGFQVEVIGASYSLYYIWSIVHLKNAISKKKMIIRTIISAFFIQLVVLIKEPFLLISIVSCLLFIDSIKDFIKCMVIPSVIGGLCYILMLFITKMFGPYFNLYILYMFSSKVSGETSAIERTKNFSIIINDLANFDKFLLTFQNLHFQFDAEN